MKTIAILVAIVVILFFVKFLMPMNSYADASAPPVVASSTPCGAPAGSVAVGGACGCDADCANVATGNYCSHKYNVCREPRQVK